MNDRNKSDRVTLGMNQDNFSVEDRTGRTHPGTKERSVCGRLMLRMVSSMFCRLRLRQPANSENAQHKRYRKELAECGTHAIKTLSEWDYIDLDIPTGAIDGIAGK